MDGFWNVLSANPVLFGLKSLTYSKPVGASSYLPTPPPPPAPNPNDAATKAWGERNRARIKDFEQQQIDSQGGTVQPPYNPL